MMKFNIGVKDLKHYPVFEVVAPTANMAKKYVEDFVMELYNELKRVPTVNELIVRMEQEGIKIELAFHVEYTD